MSAKRLGKESVDTQSLGCMLAIAGHCLHVLFCVDKTFFLEGPVLAKIHCSASMPSTPQVKDRVSTLSFIYHTLFSPLTLAVAYKITIIEDFELVNIC